MASFAVVRVGIVGLVEGVFAEEVSIDLEFGSRCKVVL